MQSKIVFPTLFTLYLILLIIQKVKIVPMMWQAYATATIDTLELLWVTLVSAILANFTGLREEIYAIEHHSPVKNALTILLICLLSYASMWSIFAEIASIGRVAYFVSLGVGILVALVSFMVLTEEDENESKSDLTKNSLTLPS
jgi:CDP-diglyceride synthetase